MSETKWTPGPWRVNPLTPQSVITPDGMVSVGWFSSDNSMEPKAEANAHLIAAAPELYEALSGLMAEIADCSQFDLWDNSEKALAALAKARGER